MARSIDKASRVISGTWGELWLDDEKMVETTACQLKLTQNKTEIYLCGQFMVDTKSMSGKGTGSVTFLKVDSGFLLQNEGMQQGIDRRFTLISKLADPDAWGAERVAVYNVSFDELTLADWKSNSVGEITVPFTFTKYELLDVIEVQG